MFVYLGWNMEFSAGRSLAKQYKRLLQANDKLYKGRELHKKTSGSPLNIETIKQTHKIMIDKARHRDGKDVLVGECRKSLVFPGFHIFAPTGCNQRYMEDAIFRFHKIKKDDRIMAATNLFGNIINIHPFEDGEEIVAWFWTMFWCRWNVVYFQ